MTMRPLLYELLQIANPVFAPLLSQHEAVSEREEPAGWKETDVSEPWQERPREKKEGNEPLKRI